MDVAERVSPTERHDEARWSPTSIRCPFATGAHPPGPHLLPCARCLFIARAAEPGRAGRRVLGEQQNRTAADKQTAQKPCMF